MTYVPPRPPHDGSREQWRQHAAEVRFGCSTRPACDEPQQERTWLDDNWDYLLAMVIGLGVALWQAVR